MRKPAAAVFVMAALAAGLVLGSGAHPASARWAYGFGASDLDVHEDGGPFTDQFCANHITGRVGASSQADPNTFVPPAGPYGTRTVELYVADVPLQGAAVVTGGLLPFGQADVVPPLMTVTTDALTALSPVEVATGVGTGDLWVIYASAPLDLVPSIGTIEPGDWVAVRVVGRTAISAGRAIACNPAGAPVSLPFGALNTPRGVVADGSGSVYAADTLNNRVVKIPTGTSTPQTVPLTGLNKPYGVAVSNTGALYVADTDNDRIVRYPATSGTGQEVLPFTGLTNPYGVAVSPAGTVYVADTDHNRVVRLLAGSSTQEVVGFTGLVTPGGIAVDNNGDVYVADTGNDRVLRLPAAGGPQQVLPITGLDLPFSVSVHGGDVFVADYAHNRVVGLAKEGGQVDLAYSGLAGPLGVFTDSANVYVADTGNGRIVKLPIGGLFRSSFLGAVTDGANQGVPGLVITVPGRPPVNAFANGTFSIADLPRGTYAVKVEGVCRAPVTRSLASNANGLFLLKIGGFGSCSVDAPVWDAPSTALPLATDGTTNVTLPFAYSHFGTARTSAWISANGVIGFGSPSASFANTALPTAAAPNDAIYAFWDHLKLDGSSSVVVGTGGTAPNRRFVVEWRNVMLFDDPSRRLSFQAVLYEDPAQRIRLQYKNNTPGTLSAGTSATVGHENATGTSAYQVSYNTGLLYDGLSVRPK